MDIRRGLVTLLAAASLNACGTPATPPTPPQPNPDCISGSAVDYANGAGLGLNVSIYDENTNKSSYEAEGEQCFTKHERTMIEELVSLRAEGASPDTLQRIINDHPTVGPTTPWALRQDWNATKRDQAFNPSLEFYGRGRLGWLDIRNATGVSLPGTLMQDWELEHLTPYPVDENLKNIGPMDWNPEPGEINTFLDQIPGCENLFTTGEGYPEVQLQSSGDFVYEDRMREAPIPIRSALPPGAQVFRVDVVDRMHEIFGLYNDGYVSLRFDVHPDDNPLIGFKRVDEYVVHTVPKTSNVTTDPEGWLYSPEDYPVQPGDTPAHDAILAYQNPRIDATGPVYDHTIIIRERIPGVENLGTPFDERIGYQPLDYFGHMFYPREFSPTPIEARYADPRTYGCDPEQSR